MRFCSLCRGRRRQGLVATLTVALVLAVAVPQAAAGSRRPALPVAAHLVDNACNGGRPVAIAAPHAWLGGAPSVATTMLPGGGTVVAVSSGYPPAGYALLYAFTATCTLVAAFGEHGTSRLSLGGRTFSIAAMAPASGGGVFVAGEAAGGWFVGRVGVDGRFDPAFARTGWTVVPWPGGASAVTQTTAGDVVVGGSAGSGCCVRAWVGELSQAGAVVTTFGSGGRTAVPVLGDSQVARVATEADGDILELTGGGNMGCWGVSMAALTPTGAPVQGFEASFRSAMTHALPGVFVGDLAVRGDGFLLLGTAQAGCVQHALSTSAAGRAVAFKSGGGLDGSFGREGVASFASPMQSPVWALPERGGSVLVAGTTPALQGLPSAHDQLHLLELSPGGRVLTSFGHDGTAQLQLPYRNGAFPPAAVPVAIASDGLVSSVVSSNGAGTALQLVQLQG
ncbi:MAG TPA: hypothetical protein VME46_04840 [Acidimicrobiales bacterium]|nr:hypothetical protein [Acidimicrobiales bacterium]